MPGDINPFEPWRPRREGDDQPGQIPDDDLLRPWRSAPRRAEPEPEDSPEPEWYRSPRAPEPAWTPQRDRPAGGVGAGFVWMTVALVVAALIVWAANGGSHVSRVGAAALALWVGVLFALVVGRGWRWYGRLAWAASGVMGMAACWVFVPTLEGNSLWHAESVLAQARATPPGDASAFAAQARARREVAEDFPRFRDDLKAAERSWIARTVAAAVSQAAQERDTDPAAALTRLRAVQAALVGTEHHGQVYWDLHKSRQAAMTARLAKAEAALNALINKKEYKEAVGQALQLERELGNEARELGLGDDLAARLRGARERSLRAQAREAEITLANLLREEKYAEVAGQGRKLTGELLAEAQEMGMLGTVVGPLKQQRKRALAARVRLAQADLDALLKKNDYEAVPARARKYEEELAGESAELAGEGDRNPANLPGAFSAARETALARRAEKARKALEEALARKDYAAVASKGEEAMRELDAEGKAVGKAGWGDGIMAARRKALAARLDLARQKTKEQLAKKHYQAMGETGKKTYKDLSLEAEAVGMQADLEKFRAVCEFYEKLAREGGEDGQ